MKTVERHKYSGNEIIATRRITFKPFPYNERYIGLVMGLIERNLSPELLKGRKSLIYPDDVNTNKWYGHCYHATQALFYSLDTDLLVPMSAEDYRGEKHWWIFKMLKMVGYMIVLRHNIILLIKFLLTKKERKQNGMGGKVDRNKYH